MSSGPEKSKGLKAPPEAGERSNDDERAPHGTSATQSVPSAFDGKVPAQLVWKDGMLVGIQITGMRPGFGEPASAFQVDAKTTVWLGWLDRTLIDVRVQGAFLDEGRPASRTRHVFKAENEGNMANLAADPSACPAWIEYSEGGAPTRIEFQHGAASASSNALPRASNSVILLDWKDGSLARVRVQGDFQSEAAQSIRRTFRVQHRKNEVSLVAEGSAEEDADGSQVAGDNKTLRSIDKTVRGLEKKVATLDLTLRQDMLDIASGVVGAMWHAQGTPHRVNAALPLVLISQVHRSGGTLLARLFDGHPEIFAFPQELRWRDDEVKYRWPNIDPSAEGPLRIAKRLMAINFEDAKAYNLFGYEKTPSTDLDQRLPFQWSQWAYVETFLETWQAKPPRNRRECLDIFMTAYFSAFLNWRQSPEPKKIITAFKTRMNFIRAYPENEAFFDDYPDGLMISICRHPADWYASATHGWKTKYTGVNDAMAVWRESTECTLQLKERHPSQIVLVSFEGLIADPAKAMRWIAGRIGVTWDSILTIPTFNGMPVASNSSFEPAIGVDASVLRRREALPTQVIEQIEVDNLPLYQQFIEAAEI